MIPDGVLSTQAYFGPFIRPVRMQAEYLRDYELAGNAIQDGTKGMQVRIWTAFVIQNSQVWVSAPGVPPSMLFDRGVNLLEIALAFDNNMNPFVTFREGAIGTAGNSFIYWFDSTDSTQKFTALPAGVKNPRCCVDEHRPSQTNVSDVVLSYIRGQTLYARYQRERYTIEHALQASLGPNAELVDVSMNQKWRLMWHLKNTATIPGAVIFENPKLGDVVKLLCRRAGILPENIDVSELYDQDVIGYKINTKDGINARIDALRKVFFFDKSESDRMISFPRRGREVSARIPYAHLVADDPSALGVTIIQEKELPLAVHVTHLDPAGGFAQNKQTVRRKSNLISAKTERTIESEIVLTADQAATTALIESVSSWAEPQKYKFKTYLRYSMLCPTDTVEVEDKNGDWHIMRITERNDNRSVLEFECVADAQELYASLGVGKSLPPPVSTTPGLIGPTRLEILNIPCLRDQDDELGVYIAVCGESSGWFGAQILIATDGINFAEAMTIETPATIGDLQTALSDEVSAEYPSNQSFEVLTNYALESVSRESLLNNINRCVVGDEVMQFQTALFLGMVDEKYRYRCSGLIRGRYATEIEAWPAGSRFVLIDTSIAFMQAQQWMLGREISIKPVSSGQTEDETTQTDYDYDVGTSQLEFPVSDVTAVRVGSDVTTSFIGRGRLGVGSAPRNGKYFLGYRVKYSNGQSFDVQTQSHTYASAPAGITVQVCAINSVTGEGPLSSPVAT